MSAAINQDWSSRLFAAGQSLKRQSGSLPMPWELMHWSALLPSLMAGGDIGHALQDRHTQTVRRRGNHVARRRTPRGRDVAQTSNS